MLSSSMNRSKVFNCVDHIINTSNELDRFRDIGHLVDIVLVAGLDNIKVQAHRLILSASSSYFRKIFKSGLKEVYSEEIGFADIDGITLKLVLDFLYSGKIALQSDRVEHILKAAYFLQITSLIDACWDFMADGLDPCNCLGICLLAEQHNYTALFEKSREFAYDYFEDVCAENEFLHLSKEQLTSFLFATEFCITSAGLVLESIVSWIEHDKPNREEFVCSLLSHVRFTSLDPKFVIENTKSICKSPECRELVHKWLEWHLSPENRSTLTTEAKTIDNFILGTCGSGFKFQSYDPGLEKWSYKEWPHPLKDRWGFGMIVVNNKLIIVGGEISGNETATVECLDLQTMKWTELPPMKEARCLPGLAELNGHLYVVGGLSGDVGVRSVEVFDFTLRTWIYSEPLPRDISSVQVAALNGFLYVGGTDSPLLECYNSISCEWSHAAPFNHKLENLGMAAVGGHLYAAGTVVNGAKMQTLDVEWYDPENNTWVEVKSLESVCFSVECASLNNRLILCYIAFEEGERITKVKEYDPETDKWITLSAPLSDKFYFCHLFTMQIQS